ncbi:MAG: nucleotidyltransferase family protein [Oscillospiraceae bacterium]
MRICGIIAEYNPFHNGHLYQINELKKMGATHIISVMSGSFVQRAEPAVLPKFERARVAVQCGADIVLELPCRYATASAERFAFGGVSLLRALGCVDMLGFGSESGDLAGLLLAADAVCDAKVLDVTRALCERGETYPSAREKAARSIYGDEAANLLREPNDILAVEYLKALHGCAIEPVAVRRVGAAHDGEDTKDGFAGASLLRLRIEKNIDIQKYVPPETAQALQNSDIISCGMKRLELPLLYRLRTMDASLFEALPNCADGLGNRLKCAAGKAKSLEELYDLAKTKRYTMSRVRRAALCALLGIMAEPPVQTPYARVLAIGKNGGEVLARMKKTASIPISQSLKELAKLGGRCAKDAALEAYATDISALSQRVVGDVGRDYTQKLFRDK